MDAWGGLDRDRKPTTLRIDRRLTHHQDLLRRCSALHCNGRAPGSASGLQKDFLMLHIIVITNRQVTNLHLDTVVHLERAPNDDDRLVVQLVCHSFHTRHEVQPIMPLRKLTGLNVEALDRGVPSLALAC